jgi:hypothetical protein
MTALIDADFLVYRTCYSKGKDFIQILEMVDWYLSDIIRSTQAEKYKVFLSGSTNFRKELATIQEYKGTRKKEKPKFYHEVRDYMVGSWGAEVSSNCEADDLCGVHQTEESIIIGEDKDLLTIPGWHYRIARKWDDNCKILVSPEEACRNFYVQCLAGDVSDSIPGLLNPEKLHFKNPPRFSNEVASSLLEGKSPEEMKAIVVDLYKQIHKDEWYPRFDEVCRLLFIRRKGTNEYFEVF